MWNKYGLKMTINKGFTLIELMITVAIMSIMLAIGLPSFQSIIASSRLTSSANAMVSALQLARAEALKQHKTVVIRKKDDDWAKGWEVFVDDLIENKTFDPGETVLVISSSDAISPTMTVVATYSNYVSYGANGRINIGGHFTFCSGSDYRSVVIAATGRVRVEIPSSCS